MKKINLPIVITLVILNGFFLTKTFKLDLDVNNISLLYISNALADGGEENETDTKWLLSKDRFDCEGEYILADFTIKSISCTNCAWDCDATEVDADYPVSSNCSGSKECDEVLDEMSM